ncbi:MAG: aldo/keto reductase [Candidatus Sumerlaeota bacterium]|nr:aldo/keto reductase [Candidatus Sumerlaeota bacterium]
MMDEITRRQMLKRSLAGAGVLAAAPLFANAAGKADEKQPSAPQFPLPVSASDKVALGKTGIKASFLAMGTGMRGGGGKKQSDLTRQGEEKAFEILRHCMDQGLNFFDTADLYGTMPFVGKALKGTPREKYVLLTKLWPGKMGDWMLPSGGAKEEIERFRKELNSDVIDVCLIHCMQNDKWTDQHKRIMDELSELKSKKTVLAVGVSCHHLGALKMAAEHPWVDLIFARINNKSAKMDGPAEEVSKVLLKARANGKAVVGMKIFGEGTLIQPEQKDASLQYVISNRLVDAMTIGMLKVSEVDDNIERINKTLKGLKA